jgi:hypothetical protein
MTDEEADALDELLTRTTPTLGPNGTGFLSRNGFIVGSLAADTAEYLRARAAAARKTQAQVIDEIVHKEMALSGFVPAG